MSTTFIRNIEVIEMSNNYQRKMSILDELSLNVDKKSKEGSSTKKQQNGISTKSQNAEAKIEDNQIEIDLEKKLHDDEPQMCNVIEQTKIIETPKQCQDIEEFCECRLTQNLSLFIIHNQFELLQGIHQVFCHTL